MSWMVIELYSDVVSRPTLGRRGGASLRGLPTVAWRGLGPIDTKRSALGTHLSVDTYEYS